MSTVTLPAAPEQPETKTQKVPKKARPWPLTGGHPLRAMHNRIQILLTSLVFGGHGLAFTFVGLYYLAFSLIPAVHNEWNILFSHTIPIMGQHTWDTWRHLFRDDGEPFMATLGIGFFLYNPYAHSVRKITSPWQILAYVGTAIGVLIPVLIGGNLALQGLHHSLHAGLLTNIGTHHPNFAERLYADGNVASKIFTVFAGMIASKFVMPPVYDYTQRYFANRKVAHGKKTHFYHTPPYRGLVNDAYEQHGGRAQALAQAQIDKQGNLLNRFMLGGGLLAVGLAGLGIYVLKFIAA